MMHSFLTETSQEQLYRGFACPQEGLDQDYLETITVRYSRRVLRTFINRFGPRLEETSPGLKAVLENWLEQKKSNFDTAWHFTFGEIRAALLAGVTEPLYLKRAAALALHLHASGSRGSWDLQLDAPARLTWGHWQLPLADHLDVWACEGRARLSLSYQGETSHFYFQEMNGWWSLENCSSDRLVQLPQLSHRLSLLPLAALDSPEFDDIRDRAVTHIGPDILAAYSAAFEVLDNYAPVYRSWVARVLRGIAPVAAPKNVMLSGSGPLRPGVIYMSCDAAPVALGELLVHEATHQYCHLLQQLGKLDDGSDPTLYYSPVKRTGRPVAAIAVTYHAFANMLLYYRMCRENGFADPAFCLANEQTLAAQLGELEKALRTSPALTALGQALWEPLSNRLAGS